MIVRLHFGHGIKNGVDLRSFIIDLGFRFGSIFLRIFIVIGLDVLVGFGLSIIISFDFGFTFGLSFSFD